MPRETMEFLQSCIDSNMLNEVVANYVKNAVDVLGKHIPHRPIHVHKQYPTHDWKLNSVGEIDTWAWANGYHNGPVCQRCHHSPCEYCNPSYDTEKCVVNVDICYYCGFDVDKSMKYCPQCGQALDWSEIG